MSLTAYERETIITMNDEEDIARIWTAQRRIITKLRRNQAAKLIEEGTYGRTAWASFEIPSPMVSFRSTRRRATAGSGQGFASQRRALQNEK